MFSSLHSTDPDVFTIVSREGQRQNENIELTASANFVSRAVLEATGSLLTNKVAEGYPGRRYFSGCEYIDEIENLAIARAKKLFGAAYVNVEPYSGSQANQAVYLSVLKPGDCLLSMDLGHGGHLSHGAKATMTGKNYDCHFYHVNPETERLDYEQILALAEKIRPKLIIAGASSYPRLIDFQRFREIADQVGALLLADIAHIAGLIAVGLHPSPIPHAHFVTTTTQKTLRGPRGGMILLGEHSAEEWGRKLNSGIFPGMQGAVHMHTIAAKAVMLKEALDPSFAIYQRRNLDNASTLAEELTNRGFRLVSGGTDNHLMLLDLRSKGITGKEAEERLFKVGITANKNLLPYDPEKPRVCSGIRLGTPAITTRGFGSEEMPCLADLIDKVLSDEPTAPTLDFVRKEVTRLCQLHPSVSQNYGDDSNGFHLKFQLTGKEVSR
ncbi:MAG: serine hydroxymethyltransferase [Symploca sp. SIO3C6]|uniref:Probable serine hydroxymethyltransferase n=1 Tax=Symploca sp. SIO1C4 TaxID=2607765 RepID=A0A6B3NCQ0_9CYAN|nr:serine hydroxymethyltransferase [Symploca sp. SIO3C6]NER28705.1 serine hydroxymethyltransferase [Symploca sp. SIO1C4]NET08464.1 serine hydroxymethyltransferase [Symploca sp. SIO2B6]